MESKRRKAAEIGASASIRAAEMIVQMARGKARAAAAQVKRMRKQVKAAKQDFKRVKKVARQAKKSLKTAQTALSIAKTQIAKEVVRKAEPGPASTRPAVVRPRRQSATSRPRRKLPTRQETDREGATGSPAVCAQPTEFFPPGPAAATNVPAAISTASEPNAARP
jgi:hypothetical protein